MRASRAYYKWVESVVPFTFPTLVDNGIMGGSACAVSASSQSNGAAFNVTSESTSSYWRSGNTSCWIQLYSPTQIKVSAITWAVYYSYPRALTVEATHDAVPTLSSTWDTLCTLTNIQSSNTTGTEIAIPVNAQNYYKTYRISVSAVSRDLVHCARLVLDAVCIDQVAVLSSVADADFTVPPECSGTTAGFATKTGNMLYAHAESKVDRRYYKDTTQVFMQPALSANGTVGGSSFAVNTHVYGGSWGQPVWKVFDKNESTYAEYSSSSLSGSNSQTIRMYNPIPIKVSSVVIKQGPMYPAKYIEWAYSDDGNTWSSNVSVTISGTANSTDTIEIGESYGEHKYWRIINARTYGGENDDWSGASRSRGRWGISEITINAATGGIVEVLNPTSPSDYDYYVDNVTTKIYGAQLS